MSIVDRLRSAWAHGGMVPPDLLLDAIKEIERTRASDARVEREQAVRVRHRARGTDYTVKGEGTLQTARPLTDGAALVVYQGDDGKWWLRPPAEFHDGRFEPAAVVVPSGERQRG